MASSRNGALLFHCTNRSIDRWPTHYNPAESVRQSSMWYVDSRICHPWIKEKFSSWEKYRRLDRRAFPQRQPKADRLLFFFIERQKTRKNSVGVFDCVRKDKHPFTNKQSSIFHGIQSILLSKFLSYHIQSIAMIYKSYLNVFLPVNVVYTVLPDKFESNLA